jgi:transcriptional regulator with XRE-family HTH domain
MTQTEAASRAGVRQGLLSEIESGVANPTLATLGALAQALGGRLDVTSLPGAPPARSRAPRR